MAQNVISICVMLAVCKMQQLTQLLPVELSSKASEAFRFEADASCFTFWPSSSTLLLATLNKSIRTKEIK